MLSSVAAVALALSAQDFGVEWLDRVTHDVEQPRYPLSVHPVETQLQAGAMYEYDSNVFFDPTRDREHGASVILPFARARLDYAAPRWDAAADLLVDYRRYEPEAHESGDDERAYGRIRYAGPRVTLEVAEILLHESDPVDVQIPERVDRIVSTTTGHGAVEVTHAFSLEADVQVEVARFRDPLYDGSNNEMLRAGAGAAFRVSPSLEVLAQGGWLMIDYTHAETPGAQGAYGRVGVRGDPVSRLSVTALVGVIGVRSETVPSTGQHEEARTADVSINLRYEPMDGLVLWADYTREIGFAEPGDPFEVIDRAVLIGEWQATPKVSLRARLERDDAKSALGVEHTWWSLGPTATWAFSGHIKADLGVTYRRGELSGAGQDTFSDVVGHLGVVFTR
ncbi:MAG TPA: hypothetical protein VEN81_08660 [Planctomycetota bacterium]|nr:hypothetical protein [Planctomycetota bacterium]